jgi:hypothetical protein
MKAMLMDIRCSISAESVVPLPVGRETPTLFFWHHCWTWNGRKARFWQRRRWA